MSRTSQTDVLIIGGGLAGMACAVGLAGSGLHVTLLEAQASLGGRAGSARDSATGDVVDLGPHILLTEYRNMLSLLQTLGTQDGVMWQKGKLITLLSPRGATVMRTHRLPPPLHLLPSMLKAPDLSLREKLSNARAAWLAMHFREQQMAALDAIPASELLERLRVSPRFIDWFWRSASMSLMNVPLEQCSSGALLRFFSQLIGHNDYRIGFASSGLAELFVPAATERIARHGGDIRVSSGARVLLAAGSRCEGAVLRDGARIRARWCVAAVPPAELYDLLPQAWRQSGPLAAARHFRPSPYLSLYLWFDRKLTREPFWARVWSPATLNYDFYDLSNIRSGWEARCSVIASNVIYSERVAGLGEADVLRITLDEIAEFAPRARRARVLHHRIHRIPMAIPSPHPGTECLRPQTASPFAGLLLAGDWTRTLLPSSMESAVRSGYLAAEHILEDIGRPRPLAQPARPTEGFAGMVRRWAQHRQTRATLP